MFTYPLTFLINYFKKIKIYNRVTWNFCFARLLYGTKSSKWCCKPMCKGDIKGMFGTL